MDWWWRFLRQVTPRQIAIGLSVAAFGVAVVAWNVPITPTGCGGDAVVSQTASHAYVIACVLMFAASLACAIASMRRFCGRTEDLILTLVACAEFLIAMGLFLLAAFASNPNFGC